MNTPDRTEFRDALARFASGVTVVTVRDPGGEDHGMTVSAFSSLSLDPPLVLLCIGAGATILPRFRASGTFGISILAAGQHDIARRFADQGVVRFEGIAFSRAASGPALLDGAVAQLECRRLALHQEGDHFIAVGEVLLARTLPGEPLVHFRRGFGRFEPRAADGGH